MIGAFLLALFLVVGITLAGIAIVLCLLQPRLAEYDRRANELHAEPGTN